ncbi:hypothetical protein [Pedobacter sp. B4-66]|uniref:hypothetical protein n=1 Tax=Pedobacter sp. B4-66 TaxID=2817280 RepID=UPI001BD92D5F|nr:hypothetical protein [Pedobacter sp. B4-66]
MKNELHILTSYVGILLVNRPIYNNAQVLESVKEEIGRLKEVFFCNFNQAQERCQIRELLNVSYLHLTELSDRLWERARVHNPIARSAMLMVGSLMDYMTKYYGNFLDKNNALTAFERFKLEHKLIQDMRSIAVLLKEKKVSEPLIHQVLKAFQDLFSECKHGVLSCADRKYIQEFVSQLSDLAYDKRDKDWNLRIRRLLIKYNFNHMGICKFLEIELEKQAISIKSYKKQHRLLYEKGLWLEEIQCVQEVAYNWKAMSLMGLLTRHISRLKEHLNEQRLIEGAEKAVKLKHNLSVDEMALEFHYNHGEKVYDYRTKRAAAEVFCSHNQSIGTTDASLNSFLNFDRMNRSAAIKLYQRIGRIQKKLAGDFEL